MDKKVEELPTYKINDVEVFSAGVWNKDKYEINDLHNIVQAFNNLKEGFRPYLKLGHDDKQKLAKSSGLPSVGWVENLRVQGEKLLADLNYIPKEIFKLIKSKAYRKVSCEIYWNLDVNGQVYPKVLGAISLLGAENPGVMNLADILGQYNNTENYARVYEAMNKQDNFKHYESNLSMGDEDMSEEIQKIQKELDEQKKNYAVAESEKSELQKKLDEQATELKKFQLEVEKANVEAKAAKVAQFVADLENQKLSTPGMKELLTELMSDKKEYTIKEKQTSKEEVIKEILKLSNEAAKVNFEESSKATFGMSKNKDEEMNEKIEKYQQEHKCDYARAYKAVMKDAKSDSKDMKE